MVSFENPFNNLAEAEAAQAENGVRLCPRRLGPAPLTSTPSHCSITSSSGVREPTNSAMSSSTWSTRRTWLGSHSRKHRPAPEAFESPTINVAAGQNFIELGDNNDVNNFEINGGVNAVTGNAINAPQLANLDINAPTGTGISFTDITGTAVVDNTVTITDANQGMLIDGGSAGMNINARITNSIGNSLLVENRTVARSHLVDRFKTTTRSPPLQPVLSSKTTTTRLLTSRKSSTPLKILIWVSTSTAAISIPCSWTATTKAPPSPLPNLAATAADADTILFNDGGTLTINDTNDESLIQNTGTGNAFTHVGSAVADEDSTITVAANITNLGGGEAVNISNHTENNITFSGDITDTNSNGIELTNNAAGTIAFNGQVTITNTGAGNGVNITTGGEDVIYTFTDIDININSGTGFSVTGDGTLNVSSAEGDNLVQTTSGTAINLDGLTNGLTIGSGGAIFDEVNVVNGAADTNAVVLRDLDGGQVRIGPTSGTTTGGTLAVNGTGTGILIDDAANVSVNNVNIDKNGTGQGMLVINQEHRRDNRRTWCGYRRHWNRARLGRGNRWLVPTATATRQPSPS